MIASKHSPATPPSPWADVVGMWTSALCVVHCLATPLLLSFAPVFVHSLPSEERTHRFLAVCIALAGALAIVRGFRLHRRQRVVWLTAAGMSCIVAGAWFGDRLPEHWMEVAVTFAGSACMISAHRLNRTFCRACICGPAVCAGGADFPDSSSAADLRFQPLDARWTVRR